MEFAEHRDAEEIEAARRIAELSAVAAEFRDAFAALHSRLGEVEGDALLERCEALRARLMARDSE